MFEQPTGQMTKIPKQDVHYNASMEIIAHIHTDFPQKFGIPRQSGLIHELRGRIVFEPQYAREEAVRGLEGFSHIWLLWEFQDIDRVSTNENRISDGSSTAENEVLACENGHASDGADEDLPGPYADEAAASSEPENRLGTGFCMMPCNRINEENHTWSPMVRPPLLGGNRRMGVFATRSPFRPNAIGLSSVVLERVENTAQGPVLHVRGADLRDNTPIYDIKPYLPATDSHPDARAGFTEEQQWKRLEVSIPHELLAQVPEDVRDALLAVLAEDPRPARQRAHENREYNLAFADLDVTFTVHGTTLTVSAIR